MSAFGELEPDFERDGWGRPIVRTLNGERKAYTRCTTFVSALEDTAKLADWKQRMVAIGLSRRNDLLLRAASLRPDDRDKLNDLCKQALDAAAASAAATTGTALHAMTETLDRGESIEHMPPDAKRDLAAYEAATRSLTVLDIERHLVLDEFMIGGTCDRVVEYEGRRYIADIKTGSVDFGQLKIAMQLAVYAHSEKYDVKTAQRSRLDVDRQRGIVIHLPAGQGTCRLLWTDIGAAWEAIPLAKQVRDWRSRGRKMMTPLSESVDVPLPIADGASSRVLNAAQTPSADVAHAALCNAVASAASVDELTSLWRANARQWDEELTQLAAARKALLAGAK
jgi:hypothetical protein